MYSRASKQFGKHCSRGKHCFHVAPCVVFLVPAFWQLWKKEGLIHFLLLKTEDESQNFCDKDVHILFQVCIYGRPPPFLLLFRVFFLPSNNCTSILIYCLNSFFPAGGGKKFRVHVLVCLNISNAAGKFCQPFFQGTAKWNCQKLIVCFKIWLCSLRSWKVWECKYKSLKPNLKITDLII